MKAKWLFKRVEYRLKILRTLLLSDKRFKAKRFQYDFGREIQLSPPQTFNEKIIFRMLFDRNQRFTALADKVSARAFITQQIGEKYVVPTLGIYSSFDQIDFAALPQKFVIKCSHDSASAIICTDKDKFDIASAREKISFYLSRNMYVTTRERHYKNIVPRIICEQYLDVFGGADRDITPELLRVHCFAGQPKFIEVDFTDARGEESVNIYDQEWQRQEVAVGYIGTRYPNNLDERIRRPARLDAMLTLSRQLSADFDYCRMDWFLVGDDIYFSEFTFTPCAGRMRFFPASFDRRFGEQWRQRIQS
ncbi:MULTISPECIES: ATP-grasp fold amidoligase family protein [Edwardsiella]|uniref:Glycosyltransferase n=2 Tax=Edwardsiella anguillarum TaxID=1821960 RepID=A0A076LR13_9GAMM|nr:MULTISPECIES: ATP-grasp fold amidoligase family protein [Edwardsiella]AIJ10451.1 Glycosyltransferase [Edwardsiella anguillarum ET080813]AKR77947.1 glycosyltransferase [Edwardsiella sp. LADL05-105]KAB0589600.1 glycosyltransferase [Edwardsiella anguillarum]UOU77653.1 glycosyltransferase [Edwardsiella anguillarum]WHP78890.1 glycosyltransferase [Edwardsiella anguillarum]